MGENDFTEVRASGHYSMREVPIPPKEEREKAEALARHKPKGVEVNLDELDAESADGNSPRTEVATQPSAKIPRIQLPQDDRLDSQFAAELGEIFSLKDVFRLAGCAVKVSTQAVTGQDNLEVLTAFTSEELVTWAEYHCVPFKFNVRQQLVLRSMPVEVAAKILASEQFLSRLRPIKGLDCVNLPIIRETGKLELLCVGYDAQSQTLTLPNSIRYNQELTVDEAIKFLRELLQEFPFHPEDKDRALSVTIAMILTLFCRHLFEPGTMRPGFLFSANQTGSGKSLLAKLGLVPMLGCAPTGVAPQDEEEMRKRITTTVLTGQVALFFDNFRTKLASAALEALMTSTIWEDRLLGSNKQIKAHHGLTVLLTANDANLSPDMMRRVFAIEMFNQYTDNAERKIKHWLDAKTIATKHRAPILSACWAFVRHWDKKGRPEPATWHHDFRAWTAIVCGIIEAAGLKSPCASPVLKRSGDRDGADMRQLVEFLQPEKHYTFEELIELCEDHELFERFLALQEKSIASFRSSFSKFLRRYDQRFFAGGKKFVLEGTRNNRTYRLTTDS